MYPKGESISDIVEQMDSLTSSEKAHLRVIFESLERKQEELFSMLKQEVRREVAFSADESIDIFVALVGPEQKKALRDCNFFEICPEVNSLIDDNIELKNKVMFMDDDYAAGIVFWDEDYNLISEILSKKYSATFMINGTKYETFFYLKQSKVFIEKEKEIQRLSIQYRIEKPLIYNPMARRALEIFVKMPCEIKKSDVVSIDLQFEKNQLMDKIITNSYLVWNISEKDYDELPPAKTGKFDEILPLWDKTFSIYRFPVKNKSKNVKDFIVVDNDLRMIKRVENDIYWQLKEDYTEMRYKKFSIYFNSEAVINKIKFQSKGLFHNEYLELPTGNIERIRTKGDAFRVISCFEKLGISCLEILTSKSDKDIIYTYPSKMDYYQLKDERLRVQHQCVIYFERNDEDVFFSDKVSYVLGYMNHRYPEYQWIGVC